MKSAHQPTFGATRPRKRLTPTGHTRPLAHLLRASVLLLLSASAQAATFTVNSLADDADANQADNLCATTAGACTLRAAIQQANATPGADLINVAVAGLLSPTSHLPTITDTVTIDATTAPGYTGTPVFVLSGESHGLTGSGLELGETASGSAVRGIAVLGFRLGIYSVADHTTFTRNHIGATGIVSGRGNASTGLRVEGSGIVIGRPGEGNTVSGNGGDGILVYMPVTEPVFTGNVIAANVVTGNHGDGVGVFNAMGTTIGGTDPAAANVISLNWGSGVRVGGHASVRLGRNPVHSNGALGVNLWHIEGTGITYNDPGDLDAGPNDLQNFPTLTAATDDSVTGVLRSAPLATYVIDVYSNPTCGVTGFGEAARFEATTTVTTDETGAAAFRVTFPAVDPGTVFAAMATNAAGKSSEMSQCIAIDRRPVETLTLVNASRAVATQISTLADEPPEAAYNAFSVGVAEQPVIGRYVMGDWNGDGLDTLAVYAGDGVFHYTNQVGRASQWTALWFGFLGFPPVAGRFDPAVPHDCLGVVHGAPDPPRGDHFAVYYTCDLTSGPNPPLQFQYLGPPLPDNAGFTGEYQFTAGDFDGDGVDTFAARRGPYVTWTNVPPTNMLAAFDRAQYQGFPNVGYGTVVAADWDGDGASSFGLFYPDDHLFYRNDLEWNSGLYQRQHVHPRIGQPLQPLTWRPGGSAGEQ